MERTPCFRSRVANFQCTVLWNWNDVGHSAFCELVVPPIIALKTSMYLCLLGFELCLMCTHQHVHSIQSVHYRKCLSENSNQSDPNRCPQNEINESLRTSSFSNSSTLIPTNSSFQCKILTPFCKKINFFKWIYVPEKLMMNLSMLGSPNYF